MIMDCQTYVAILYSPWSAVKYSNIHKLVLVVVHCNTTLNPVSNIGAYCEHIKPTEFYFCNPYGVHNKIHLPQQMCRLPH